MNEKEGSLQVWWIPQVPMKPFTFPVENVDEACLLLTALAQYDLFQLKHNIKPDYSNVGGLNLFEDGEWVEWYDEKEGYFIDEYLKDKYHK